MPLIETRNIKKTYTDGNTTTPVLHGISFAVEAGEFVAIMGPSGSGKSTLLHILGFLDVPTGGTYHFGGTEIRDYSEDDRARIRNEKIGFVFQSFNLLARTSVLENVMLPFVYSSVSERTWRPRAETAIHAVGLSHRLEHTPAELSGGERQRVAVARALANNPQVIFADEPTGNLDSKSGSDVMHLLAKLNEEEGHTIILITHEDEAASYAGRRIFIRDGRIVEDKKK